MCTNAPTYHYSCWFLNCSLITIQMVPLLFSLENAVCVISSVHLRWVLAQRRLCCFWILAILYMFFCLHSRVLTCICRCSNELCSLMMVFRGVCNVFHYWVVSAAWGPNGHGQSILISVMSLAYRTSSRLSESFNDMNVKYHRWWNTWILVL